MAKDGLAEVRSRVKAAPSRSRDPLDEVCADELAQSPAHMREVEPGLTGHLDRRFGPGNHCDQDRFPLPAREDVGEPI